MAMRLPTWVTDELDGLDLEYGRVKLVVHQGEVAKLVIERTENITAPKTVRV